MNRWFWKRWVWAVVVGTTATVGLTVAQQGGTDAPSGPPKVGDVITLKFRDLPDRQVKVLKSEKQPDGSYLSEVKDTKSGETFTLMDKPDVGSAKSAPTPPPAAPASKGSPSSKAAESPKVAEAPKQPEPRRSSSILPKLADGPAKAKARANDPLVPDVKDSMPADMAKDVEKDKDKEKERRFFPSLSKSSANPKVPEPPAAAPAPAPEPEEDRPGLLKRVFGRKKPTPASTPTTQGTPATQSGVRTAPTITMEPPRSSAVRPVEPPTPIVPTPVSIPTGPATPTPLPAASVPIQGPAALPPIPIPSVPAVGVPSPGGLPSIPVPPGGTSKNVPTKPKSEVATAVAETSGVVKADEKVLPAPAAQPVPLTVVPATRVVAAPAVPVVTIQTAPPQDPVVVAMMQDIQPFLTALQDGPAPSHRAIAARALSGCRHNSSDLVKMSLFRAAQSDGNPMVKAVCIEELVKLGYFEPAFTVYLTKASEDSSEEVRKAAKEALHQMQPRR